MHIHIRSVGLGAAFLLVTGWVYAQPDPTDDETTGVEENGGTGGGTVEDVPAPTPSETPAPVAEEKPPAPTPPPVETAPTPPPSGEATEKKPPDDTSDTDKKKSSSDGSEPAFLLFGQGSAQLSDVTSSDVDVSGRVGGGLGYESGVAYVKIWYNKGSIETVGATMNDEGTVESAEEADYGRTILDPLSAKMNYGIQAGILPWVIMPGSRLKPRLTFSGYLLGSKVEWGYPNEANDEVLTKEVLTVAFGGCVGVLGRGRALKNKARLGVDLCGTRRSIGGDMGIDKGLRQRLLGNETNGYYGAEFHAFAGLGNITVDFQLLYLTGGSEGVDGLTGFRLIPGLVAEAPLRFPLDDD